MSTRQRFTHETAAEPAIGATRLLSRTVDGGTPPVEDIAARRLRELAERVSHAAMPASGVDDDGRLDLVTTALGTPARVWRNVTTPAGHWLAVRLVGAAAPRDGVGALVRVGKQVRLISTATSYASSRPALAHFGLGAETSAPAVEVPAYRFQTLSGEVSLLDLFAGRDVLFAIHNMGQACRYCTLWADGLNGFLPHLEDRFAVVKF